jgi:16S rRNA (guanine1516-N2)-methyltransferase
MSDSASVCTVVPAQADAIDRARLVAGQLDLAFEKNLDKASGSVALIIDREDAWLQEISANRPGPVRVDFASPAMMHRRRGGQNELLGRAVGNKGNRHPWVFDATAGLGRDAFVLADLGCQVAMFERSPVLAFILQEGLSRAIISQFPEVRQAAAMMSVQHRDSTEIAAAPEQVIYLDPMFEERKGTAASKKDLRVLQALHGYPPDHQHLTDWAFAQPVSRIVVKRPLKAVPMTGPPPSHTLKGKAVRFDVYVR